MSHLGFLLSTAKHGFAFNGLLVTLLSTQGLICFTWSVSLGINLSDKSYSRDNRLNEI
jgi:hypothetical protein